MNVEWYLISLYLIKEYLKFIFVWKDIWFNCNVSWFKEYWIYEMNISKLSNNEVKSEIYDIIKFSFEISYIKTLKYTKI